MMSNITWLRTNVEKNRISAITAMAPAKAPSNMEKKPEKLKPAAVMLPPKSSITTATPRPAPELTPSTEAPARGLRKAVCKSKPHTASALPASKAVSAWGKRASHTI